MICSPRRAIGSLCTASALSAFVALGGPAAAQADIVSLDPCDSATLTQPFVPWADASSYKLAPGGDFENGLAGWTLSGGADQGSGSEPYGVTGSVGAASLSLPVGASATSPATCVDAAYPTFRFFDRSDTPGASVAVSVIYATSSGTVTIPVGTAATDTSWQPSELMVTGSAVPGALNGGTANVQLRFTAVDGGVHVDDAYIDPKGRCC